MAERPAGTGLPPRTQPVSAPPFQCTRVACLQGAARNTGALHDLLPWAGPQYHKQVPKTLTVKEEESLIPV